MQPRIFIAWFRNLTRAAKIVVTVQLLAMTLVLGQSVKQVVAFRNPSNKSGVTRLVKKPTEIYYSSFLDLLEKSGKGHTPGENPAVEIENVQIGKERIAFRVKQDEEKHKIALQQRNLVASNDVSVKSIEPRDVFVTKISADQHLIDMLRANDIPFRAMSNKSSQTAALAARSAIAIFYLFFLMRMYRAISQQGGSGKGDTPGKLANESNLPLVKFSEIEGIDKAKYEVMELVDTLRNPQKYTLVGARPPTGLLLVGPPGTGKTMLARATAATAGVPLLYCSGSDFVEMFVGRGAARVRKTFARAAKLSPCIIFIDEIDALGKSRDRAGLRMQSNDEAEQTLNQLLACMDGLDSSKGVIVLAATNRKEILDPALVRPGRFDRIVEVELPGVEGRERILRVHASKLKGFKEGIGIDEKRKGSLGKGNAVDLSAVAASTPGLCGAELEYIVNEAAIRAVRRVGSMLRDGKKLNDISPSVTAEDFEESVRDFFKSRKNMKKGIIENVFSGMT